MVTQNIPIKPVIVSDSESDLPGDNWRADALWLNTVTGKLNKWSGSNWVELTHAESHEHAGADKINQLGDVHFRGKVYATSGSGNEGLTGILTIGVNKALTVKKGIITGYSGPIQEIEPE